MDMERVRLKFRVGKKGDLISFINKKIVVIDRDFPKILLPQPSKNSRINMDVRIVRELPKVIIARPVVIDEEGAVVAIYGHEKTIKAKIIIPDAFDKFNLKQKLDGVKVDGFEITWGIGGLFVKKTEKTQPISNNLVLRNANEQEKQELLKIEKKLIELLRNFS